MACPERAEEPPIVWQSPPLPTAPSAARRFLEILDDFLRNARKDDPEINAKARAMIRQLWEEFGPNEAEPRRRRGQANRGRHGRPA